MTVTAGVLPVLVAADQALPDWANYGLLGVFVVAILVTKLVVPGWVYQACATENVALRAENTKLREDKAARERELSESTMQKLVDAAVVLRDTQQGLMNVAERKEDQLEPLVTRLQSLVADLSQRGQP